MIDPFTLAMIGGALGAATSKKKPLQGALLGAGMGYTGGLLAPGGATAATYGTGLGSQQTAMLAAQDAGLGAASASSALQPFGQAVMAANATKGLLSSPDSGVQASPISPTQNTGTQGLTQLVQGGQQSALQQMQQDMQNRERRKQMISRIGGGYGLIG